MDQQGETITLYTKADGFGDKSRVLVMTAVAAERDAVLRGLRGDSRFDVIAGGVGAAAAAASTAKALATSDYGLVVSAGIAGGFAGKAEVGSIVVADRIVAADLGVETSEGFCSLDELGFGTTLVNTDSNLLHRFADALHATGLPIHIGPIITVTTATGTAATAAALAERVSGVMAEAMEGYGAAIAAQSGNVPMLELRAISNPVGPRDRSAWRIEAALEALQAASSVLASSILWEVIS
ncbi:MAG: futalosine hydrolase [Bacilli bacterium]|nr:futalosine hydrolase [Bacilli bacterium]